LSIGHDSWQAEQRKPYFLANAGMAFASWLLRARKIRARAKARNCGTLVDLPLKRDCVPICMPDSSDSIVFNEKIDLAAEP
jgi:hypothetical protein